jgi:hypothetical protein
MGLVGEGLGFRGASSNLNWLLFTWLAAGYVVAYLGIGRLIVIALRQLAPVGIAAATLIQVSIAGMGALVPALLQAWMQSYRFLNYSTLQASNWVWTLAEAAEGDIWAFRGVPTLIGLAAVIIFIVNLFLTTAEVEQVRQETPLRVLQDEAMVQ